MGVRQGDGTSPLLERVTFDLAVDWMPAGVANTSADGDLIDVCLTAVSDITLVIGEGHLLDAVEVVMSNLSAASEISKTYETALAGSGLGVSGAVVAPDAAADDTPLPAGGDVAPSADTASTTTTAIHLLVPAVTARFSPRAAAAADGDAAAAAAAGTDQVEFFVKDLKLDGVMAPGAEPDAAVSVARIAMLDTRLAEGENVVVKVEVPDHTVFFVFFWRVLASGGLMMNLFYPLQFFFSLGALGHDPGVA